MASDPMALMGLYLDMKRRRQQDQQFQQRQQMQSEQSRQDALAKALALATQTGDSKLATGVLEAYGGGMSRQQDWDLVDAAAKHARKQQKLAEEAAERKAATPKGAEQTDLARGVASILSQGGDPRLNALAALRSYNTPDPQLNTRIAMRGGAIASTRAESAKREQARMEAQASITDKYRQRREERKPPKAGGKPRDDRLVNSAWEEFQSSDMGFEQWRESVPTSVANAAMKHPGYVEMLRQRRKNAAVTGFQGVPFRLQDEEAATPGEIKTPYGVLREKKK